MNLFRNLTKNEVEVRRGRKVGQDKVELLIYKTARTDMNLLDETFGCLGWSVQYKEEKGILFCGIGILDKQTNTWIWRWNSGAEGNFEAEKSVASDSMKRAGFLFGLGRELYTAPRIIVKPEGDWTQYYVDEIGYDENDRINNLRIIDDKDNIVFNFVDGKVQKVQKAQEVSREDVLKAVCSELKETVEDKEKLKKFFYYYQNRCEDFDSWNANLVRKLWNKWISK